MDASASIPLKRCSRKENCVHPEAVDGWLPATTVYFVPMKRALTGLASNCRACKSAVAKAHYAKNKERIKERVKRNTEKNAEKVREYQKRYRIENREHLNEYTREWRADNAERVRANARARYRRNRVVILQRNRRYAKENPDKFLAYAHQRLARKRALPDTFTEADWERALAHFERRCAYCGKRFEKFQIDHYIPLKAPDCPGSVPTNIVPACKSCNISKNATDPREWLFWMFGEWRALAIVAHIQAYFDSLEG